MFMKVFKCQDMQGNLREKFTKIALIIAVFSLGITILNTISNSIEDMREFQFIHLPNVDQLDNEINSLKKENRKIDSIQIVDEPGWVDHRKGAYIIYH